MSTPDEIRQRLEQMRVSVVERRQRLARHVEHREEPLPQDFAEQAVEMENDETMVALERELAVELKGIDAALARLDKGTYGSCGKCGDDIHPDRLKALPAAALCIRCASAA